MPDPPLDISEGVPGIHLIPASVQVLRHDTKLDYEIGRKVLRFGLTPLLSPEPVESCFIIARNDAGVRAADEIAAAFLGVCGII
jgi:hypothetical protein